MKFLILSSRPLTIEEKEILQNHGTLFEYNKHKHYGNSVSAISSEIKPDFWFFNLGHRSHRSFPTFWYVLLSKLIFSGLFYVKILKIKKVNGLMKLKIFNQQLELLNIFQKIFVVWILKIILKVADIFLFQKVEQEYIVRSCLPFCINCYKGFETI